MQQKDPESKPLLLKPYIPQTNIDFDSGTFTFTKLIALITVLLYALAYNILCTPLGWFGIIITAIAYKLISK